MIGAPSPGTTCPASWRWRREQLAGATFVQHAAALAAAGRTTLNEVMRISHSEE
jgi:hypothetical protein